MPAFWLLLSGAILLDPPEVSQRTTPADWKAISQTLMHTDLSVMDRVYGILDDHEVASRIARMGMGATPGTSQNGNPTAGWGISKEEILARIQELMAQLQG